MDSVSIGLNLNRVIRERKLLSGAQTEKLIVISVVHQVRTWTVVPGRVFSIA